MDPSHQSSESAQAPGQRLRVARVKHSLGADRVWREAGIAPRLLDMYERGSVPIHPDHLAALARCLGVKPACLCAPSDMSQ